MAHAELAAEGIQFARPPADRPYGVDAVMQDNSGNWLVLGEHKDLHSDQVADADFPHEPPQGCPRNS